VTPEGITEKIGNSVVASMKAPRVKTSTTEKLIQAAKNSTPFGQAWDYAKSLYRKYELAKEGNSQAAGEFTGDILLL
ncbi:hypothetical protein ACXWQS_09540, partial [Streptococcus pyogenes]